jgi:uncharacterized protein DUF2877
MTLEMHGARRRAGRRMPLWPRTSDQGARNGRDVIVPVLRSGVLARAFCRRVARADVVAVFERSLYLRSGEVFICVGGPAIGNGPLTLVADTGASFRPADLRLAPGQSASVSGRRIAIGDAVQFTFERCLPWRAPRWPVAAPAARLLDTAAALARRAALEAPPEGFGRPVFRAQGRDARQAPLARIARPRIAGFESWLRGALKLDHAPAAWLTAPQDLIGLGYGLTPSGDDFLVGTLALLDALEERDAHAALARTVAAACPAATSPLSCCLLRAAAAGHVGEHLHRAVSSVVSGNVDAAIAAARNIGHASGWDMLAGVAIALRVVAAARSRA